MFVGVILPFVSFTVKYWLYKLEPPDQRDVNAPLELMVYSVPLLAPINASCSLFDSHNVTISFPSISWVK